MRHGSGRIFWFSRMRTRLSRSVSLLAIAAAAVVLAPGFEASEKANDGEGLELNWPGTSAHAKRRKKGSSGGDIGTTYGSFSSTASSSASWGNSSGSSSGSNSGTSSASSSNSSVSPSSSTPSSSNTRNDNNSSGNSARSPSGSRRDDDQGSGPSEAGPPATLADLIFNKPAPPAPISTPAATAAPNPSKGTIAPKSGTPSSTLSAKSSLGVPTPEPATKTTKAVPKAPRAPLAPSASPPVDIGNNNHATSEILGVRLNSKAVQVLQGLGFTVPPQPKTAFDILLLTTPPGMGADAAQAMLRKEMPKEKFETNKFYRNIQTRSATGNAHSVTEASPRLTCTGSRCVARELIKWSPESLNGCTSGIAVGVLDTGLDVNHPAFARPITNSFIPEGRTPAPTWHGTAVYALLAGNARSGTPGLIPNASIYHGNVFYTDATGEVATDTHTLLSALDWMDRAGVKVVNMSFAGPRDQLMEEAIAKLSAKGMMFVAAVGNEGPTAEPAYPAAYRQVVAVTAIKADRRVYPFANRGRHIDLSAPGVDIWTAVPGGREGFYTGTSFAAPFATALVATLYRENPTPLKEKLLARLDYDDLGLPGRDSTYGRGLALAPRTCAPAPLVADKPAPPPSWGTTSIDKTIDRASTRPSTPPTVSAGFR